MLNNYYNNIVNNDFLTLKCKLTSRFLRLAFSALSFSAFYILAQVPTLFLRGSNDAMLIYGGLLKKPS